MCVSAGRTVKRSDWGRTYNLAHGRKDSLGDNLVLGHQVPLILAFFWPPMTEAELVHGVVIEEPVEDEGWIAFISLVRRVIVPGDLLGTGKENAPGAGGVFQAGSLVARSLDGTSRAANLKSVEHQACGYGLELLLAGVLPDGGSEAVDGSLQG